MPNLAGVRVLVVEDEGAVAFMIEEMLEEMGCEVAASVATVARAEEVIGRMTIGAAVLDVNLGDETTYGLAHELKRRRIPFIFSTGYGRTGLPPDLDEHPVLTKPFTFLDLQRAIVRLIATD